MAKFKEASLRNKDGKHLRFVTREFLYQKRLSSQEEYEKEYRSFLYCPNIKCNARLKHHKPMKNRGSSYFSTIKPTLHNDQCKYGYDKIETAKQNVSGSKLVHTDVVNEEHANKVFDRVLKTKVKRTKNYILNDQNSTESESETKRKNTYSSKHGDGFKVRRDPIREVHIDELSDKLLEYNGRYCIKAYLHSINHVNDNGSRYIYINCINSDSKQVFAISVSEYFLNNFPDDFEKLSMSGKHFKQQLLCIGRITYSKFYDKYFMALEYPYFIKFL